MDEKFIRRFESFQNSLDSLAEANTLIQNISEETYQQMVHRIIPFQTLLLNGAYTTKLLLDAIIAVAENNL